MAAVNFYTESLDFNLPERPKISRWIKETIRAEGFSLTELNYIFCSDEYLLTMNRKYLNHDTYTDIITFDNSDEPGAIEGDIYISIERVKDNARQLSTTFERELRRVLIHGVLHLIGYKDKNPSEEQEMRLKEDAYLSLLDVSRGTS